jgi:hypothetical protein
MNPQVMVAVLVGLVIWLIFAVIVAQTARYRGHSYALFFVLALLLSPMLAVLVMAALPYRANAGKYIIPGRCGEERPATEEQKRTLRKVGLTDEGLLRSLGTRQANGIINQLGKGNPMEWGAFVIALVVCPLAIYAIRSYCLDYHEHHPNEWAPYVPVLHLDGAPAAALPVPALSRATPAARSAPGPVVVVRPIAVPTRYGQITIPVGTQITVLAINQGRLTIRYSGETYIVPAASTNYR